MDKEDDILDDVLNKDQEEGGKERINYYQYVFIYSFLFLTVGPLFVKYIFQLNIGWWQLLIESSKYIGYAIGLSCIYIIGTMIYQRYVSKDSKIPRHPLWFRFLDGVFVCWVLILLVVYIGERYIG